MMIQTNLRSEKLEQYNFFRSRLISLCDEATPVLEKAQLIQKRHLTYSTPAEKLKADTYTLVLIGGFQSGKSTLFNYLCDGRELSPVGPCGGGIRTSGCMVTAHPVKEGESERAIVTWRSPEELLAALGNPLIKYFENPVSFSALTPNEVNLDKEEDRNKLAQLAKQELTDPTADLSDENMELLRFTLVVCRFYKQFEQRCKTGKNECMPDETVKLTSYPQTWDYKWVNIQEENTWTELPDFSEEEVQFVFCGGVELFLDSPILRNIGCSIIDCPGLFISKWDTEIASRCIREANAILYLLKGQDQLSQEAITALRECIRLGGAHKIIFGANLRKSPAMWNRVLQMGVLPQLKRNGFSNPVVYNFHASIALRMRELMYEEYGMLSQPSRSAIEYDIELSGIPSSVKDYLHAQLDEFIPMMTSPATRKLANYADNYPELEKLSGVPDFVGAASNHVLETRATSVLIHEGSKQIEGSLSQAKAEMEQKIQLLQADLNAAEELLKEEKSKLENFRSNKKLHEDALTLRLDKCKEIIYTTYNQEITGLIKEKVEDIKEITKKHIPSSISAKLGDAWNRCASSIDKWVGSNLAELKIVDRNKLKQKYAEALGGLLSEVLTQVKNQIEENFTKQSAYTELSKDFEARRQSLMRDVAAFKQLGCLASIEVKFPDSFTDAVKGMALPKATELLEAAFKEQNKFSEWIWDVLTFGLKSLCVSGKTWAEKIVDKYLPAFAKITSNHLMTCMEQEEPAGPVRELMNAVKAFKECFENAEMQIVEAHNTAQRYVNEAQNKVSLVSELESTCRTISALLEKLRTLENEIKQRFPQLSA
ncbi:MAG: dynamin family protein [Akkermansia sp.]|nr:dynamin family protein [Akkermansia sp.]